MLSTFGEGLRTKASVWPPATSSDGDSLLGTGEEAGGLGLAAGLSGLDSCFTGVASVFFLFAGFRLTLATCSVCLYLQGCYLG